jgi:hypothetical protein
MIKNVCVIGSDGCLYIKQKLISSYYYFKYVALHFVWVCHVPSRCANSNFK